MKKATSVLNKQLRADVSALLRDAGKVAVFLPLIYMVYIFVLPSTQTYDFYFFLLVMIGMPAGFLTMTITRVLISLYSSLTMGSTRKAFFLSNIIIALPIYILYSVLSMLSMSLMTLPFSREQGMYMLYITGSPASLCALAAINILTVGLGIVFGGLIVRFGRKVWIFILIALMVMGGVGGGIFAVVGINFNNFFLDNPITLLIYGTILAVSALLYFAGYRTVKNYYVG